MRYLVILALVFCYSSVQGQACYKTSVMNPSPLMGNHGEVFKTLEGDLFKVVGSYEYLYAYYPEVIACPSLGKMLIDGKTIGIQPMRGAAPSAPSARTNRQEPSRPAPQDRTPSSDAPITVALRRSGCDYFIADGPNGYYILEWYGGYDPEKGDGIFGEIRGYGFRDVLYSNGREGRLYVDDYSLGQSSAIEKIRDRCK